MQNFNIVKKFTAENTFRNAAIIGKYDLQSGCIEECFKGNIELPEKWNIGLIVGNSGTGKSTIAKELFEESYITNFEYEKEKSILDSMPENKSVEEISRTLNAVGFSSPTQWIKPYHLLSTGQQMRVDVARAILSEKEITVFDEFTSTIDRTVAQIGCCAIQKAIRTQNKKFIAVSCHYDIDVWLEPDWIFNTNSMTFEVSKKKDLKSESKYINAKTNQYGKCLQSITI
jgi:ABC-type Mn2+/Zn2+ transport system ATPase subunit